MLPEHAPYRLRPATEADFVALAGRQPDARYHDVWCGQALERDGATIGVGWFSFGYGRTWAWLATGGACPLSGIRLTRAVRAELDDLRRRGIKAVHCFRDETLPNSERWLRLLGFRPTPDIECDRLVWRCDLS